MMRIRLPRPTKAIRPLAMLAAVACAAIGLAACGSAKGAGSTETSSADTSASATSSATTTACGNSTPPALQPAVSAPSTASPGKVAIVAYSVPKPAYDALTVAYEATPAGKGTTFAASYGASGDQSRAVLNGQKADYVAFSLEPDLTKLVPELVDSSWDSGPTKGLVSDSVVVIVTRDGNPLGIKGWDDIVKPGVKIVTPDPGSSGAAKWNLLAAYAHGCINGGGQDGGEAFLKKFAANVVAKPESGSKATQTFLSGTGDVLISYENEAITARQAGKKLDYLVPDDSLLIENPAAVTKAGNATAKNFISFVQSAQGQQVFASKGFRPVVSDVTPSNVVGANDPANPFPAVKTLTTVEGLGGWSAVNKTFFDKTDGIVTKILKG